MDSSKRVAASNSVKLELVSGYRFKVTFPDQDKTTLVMDEPPPLGEMKGPNAARVMAASIANCLSASLIYCLSKSGISIKEMSADAEPIISRNKDGYWRVTKVNVSLRPELEDGVDTSRVNKCLTIFEDYCVVTGAVRKGIDVDVGVSI